jgi:hypothetical protein
MSSLPLRSSYPLLYTISIVFDLQQLLLQLPSLLQVKDTAIGTIMAPSHVYLFMGILEEGFLKWKTINLTSGSDL